MKRFSLLILWFVGVLFFCPAMQAEPVTTGTLLREMANLRRLAELPDPWFRTVQFSSYDHRSKIAGSRNWFANSDGFGREPIPNFEKVLTPPDENGIGRYLVCNIKGPGAIVRVWTAAIEGTIRMYLDGHKTPFYEGPAQEFFLQPYRKYARLAGIDDTLFAGTYQQRNACYFPIPFARGCRIVWQGNIRRIHFYQIQIRLYTPQTEVRTFRADDLKTYEPVLRRTAAILADPLNNWQYASTREPIAIEQDIQPHETREILQLKGPQAIERLTLRLAAADINQALRQAVLRIVFDDYTWGQVQAPLGDFFGAAPGINPYESVPFSVEPNGDMICRFVMPFAKSCRILIANKSDAKITIRGSVLPMAYQWDPERSMYFRARWRVDHDLVAQGGTGARDMPFLLADGQGVYVGTAVMLLNPNPVPTPAGNWWGEGDEKIFVDDDQIPSTFGTGSEDYFNYAWSSPDIFTFPYCGQPRNDGPANRGFVTNNRWHILDCLPFTERIDFYMELFSHERTPGFSYARIAYNYGQAGIHDDHLPITDEDVRILHLPANWQPAARGAAGNSIFYQAEDILQPGQSRTSIERDNLWSGGKLLVWQPQKNGDKLLFKFNCEESRRYVIHITAALTPQSGSFRGRLDGKFIGLGDKDKAIDLHVPFRTMLRNFGSQVVSLTKGYHSLELQSANPQPGRQIGIDFIWVQKR